MPSSFHHLELVGKSVLPVFLNSLAHLNLAVAVAGFFTVAPPGRKGSSNVNVVPDPSVLSHPMEPAIASASRFTMASPSPVDDSPPVGRAESRLYFWKSFD